MRFRHACLTGILAAVVPAFPMAAPPPADLPARVEAAVADVLHRTGSPSASVAVVVNDRVVLANAYGLARLDPPLKASADTRYGIGSISKEFTAAALLILQSEGKLSLDDHVSKWFPDLTDADKITLRQILSHTAGYQDFYAEDYTLTPMQKRATPESIMDGWAKKPLDFKPGEDWQYSNTGYVIAGRIVEKVTGEGLFAFLKRRIFDPLHMDGAVDNDAQRIETPPDALGYTRAALGPARPVIPEGPGWMYGAGELAMPARDVAKWDLSEIDKSLLPPAAYAEQVKTIKLNNGRDTGYAMGLFISRPGGRLMYEHGGEIAGFVSENRIYPEEKAAIVVLTNIEANGAADMIADRIADMILPPDPTDAKVKALFFGLQKGEIDRSSLAPNLSDYFTTTTVKDFGDSLGPLGTPYLFQRRTERDRGGMKFRSYRIAFDTKTVTLTVYVLPDGKLEQFLVSPAD
jgi:CubicO group peptidase (beta-lactamase class C family)